MAASTVTALSAFTPVLTDILYGVDNPGGTPVSGKFTLQALMDLFEANIQLTEANITDLGDYATNAAVAAGYQPLDADLTTIAAANNGSVLAATTASFTTAQSTKLGYLTVTQAVDLDAIETRVNELDAAVVLKGSWDASAGTFPGGGTAQAGDSYIVSVGGTVDSIAFVANDRIVAITDNASTATYASNWLKLDYTDAVLSVDGSTGAVDLSSTYQPLDADLTALAGGTLQNVSTIDATTEATIEAAIDTLANLTSIQGVSFTMGAYAATILNTANETAFKQAVNLEIGVDVQAYDADTLKADTADVLTAGFRDTLDDDGTQSSGTYTPSDASGTWSKAIVNNGAFTLAPPSPASGTVIYGTIFVTNGASAGAVTLTGWTQTAGDSFDTTNGNDFLCSFVVVDKAGTEYSYLNIAALQ